MTDEEARPPQAERLLGWLRRVSVGRTTTVSRRVRPEAAEDDFFVEWQQPGAREHQVERMKAG